jgi:hypothetical protein
VHLCVCIYICKLTSVSFTREEWNSEQVHQVGCQLTLLIKPNQCSKTFQIVMNYILKCRLIQGCPSFFWWNMSLIRTVAEGQVSWYLRDEGRKVMRRCRTVTNDSQKTHLSPLVSGVLALPHAWPQHCLCRASKPQVDSSDLSLFEGTSRKGNLFFLNFITTSISLLGLPWQNTTDVA